MSVYQNLVTLSSTVPTLVDPDSTVTNSVTGETTFVWKSGNFSIQNLSASATIYIGNSSVSSTSFGFKLDPEGTLSVDTLNAASGLYAIRDSSMTHIQYSGLGAAGSGSTGPTGQLAQLVQPVQQALQELIQL